MAKKCILILLDGLGDRSFPELGHQTPLQAAETPVLDELSARGANGLYHAALLGQALPSENAHFTMFGYDMEEFPGRGALEALGAGINLEKDEVALLSHFVSLSESRGNLILEKGKPELSADEIAILADTIRYYETDGIKIRFHSTGGIRGIVSLCGDVVPFVTDSDPITEAMPLIEVTPWLSHINSAAAKKTAAGLKSYLVQAYRRLENHTLNRSRRAEGKVVVNGLVTQRAGRLKSVTPFTERYGLRGISLASGLVYRGLSAYLGIELEKVVDTGNPGKDIAERLELARGFLDNFDFIHIHTKAPDEAAHTKDPLYKKAVIESLDRGIGRAIAPILADPDIFVIVTSDHSTPSAGPLIHSGESVPIMFWGSGVRRDRVDRFDEVSVVSGALGVIRGMELMYLILNHLDRAKLHGIMDTPVDQPFWPGSYEFFQLDSDS